MTPIAVAWLLASVFTAAGILLWIVARPMAKLSVWWQSLWPVFQVLQFTCDERTSVVIIRVPWNNNPAEYAIKQFSHYRTHAEGIMLESGLNDYLVLLSLCVTCEYKRVKFLPFLQSKMLDIDEFARGIRRKRRATALELYPKGFPHWNRRAKKQPQEPVGPASGKAADSENRTETEQAANALKPDTSGPK